MSVLIEITKAVVAHLNAGPFHLPLVAQRYYVPQFELPQMQALHVSVVPKGTVAVPLDRTRCTHDYEIDVAVQQRTCGTHEELDTLVTLTEQIADSFRQLQLPGYPQARCITVKHTAVYAPQHLAELHQFTSVLTLTFRVAR